MPRKYTDEFFENKKEQARISMALLQAIAKRLSLSVQTIGDNYGKIAGSVPAGT